MARRIHLSQVTALVLTALVISSCGSAGGSDPTTGRAPDLDPQLIAKVEAICADGRIRGLRYQPPRAGETERRALAGAIRGNLLPALQAVVDEVGALGAADEQVAQLEPMLESMQEAIDAAKAQGASTMGAVERLFSKSGRLARAARLEACIYG